MVDTVRTRTIAMTGASGFLGSRVHPLLAQRGHSVLRIGRRAPEVSVDLLVESPPWDRIGTPDTLLHCAGVMAADARSVLYAATLSVNTLSALPSSVRSIVLVSSAYVYAPSAAPVDEDVPPAPWDTYGHAKVMVEELFRGFARATERSLVILRPCAIFGPGDPHMKAISRFIADGRQGRAPTLRGPVSFQRDYIHVDDVARCVVAAIDHLPVGEVATPAAARVFNVCTGTSWSAVELAQLIGAIDPKLLTPTNAPEREVIGCRFDPSRAARELEFRAQIGVRDAIMTQLAEPPETRAGEL